MRKKVLVLFGGRSCENEVSIVTGVMAANLLDAERYEVFPVYLSQEGKLYTGESLLDVQTFRGGGYKKSAQSALLSEGVLYVRRKNKLRPVCRPDAALNCCHGAGGEDGEAAALFALNRIPDASPAVAGSAICMDKALTKIAANGLGIRTLPYFRIAEGDWRKRGNMALRCIEERLGYPVIVKPARQGSSIGITVAEDRARLVAAIQAGFAYDDLLIAEKYFERRREINCACYKSGDKYVVSPCEEPKTEHKFLTFGDKYLGGGKEHASQFPADLPRVTAETVQSITRMLYRRLRLRGVVRADFLVVGKDVYFNEMNTVPGSLAWYLFCDKLSDFKEMLTRLIEQGICDHMAKSGKKMLKNCGVLSSPALTGKNRG